MKWGVEVLILQSDYLSAGDEQIIFILNIICSFVECFFFHTETDLLDLSFNTSFLILYIML